MASYTPEDFQGPDGNYIVVTWDGDAEVWRYRPVVGGPRLDDADLVALGLVGTVEPEPETWAFPVGEGQYPPEMWYAASIHDPTGTQPQPLGNPRMHLGIDLNGDFLERGDVERRLGLSVFSVARGVVHYVTANWSGVGMIVVRHEHEGAPLYARYAHIVPAVMVGQAVEPGQVLGPFGDWPNAGDHLHFDMAFEPYTREYPHGITFVDPVPILKAHLDDLRVQAMLDRG